MSDPEAERRDYLFEHGDDRREERARATVATGTARTGTTSVRTMAATSTARTVAMIGTARATSWNCQHNGDGRNDDFGGRRHNAGRDFERSDSRDFGRPRKPRRNERSHEEYGSSYDERSHDGRRQSMRNTPHRAKAASASIARTRTASYATSVPKAPSVTNAA